jgi:aminoglycoside phosphotransferase (APT) family kinase protein
MTTRDSPAAEIEISSALVRSLLTDQHPDLAELELQFLAEGWDNSQFRLGQELIVRLPRRKLAVRLIEHEQAWLPRIGPTLPLPIPVPVRFGRPSALFPWPWSIVGWIAGSDAMSASVSDTTAEGIRLGRFFAALHTPAPASAPENRFRGVPLAERAERDGQALQSLRNQGHVPDDALTIWKEALHTPPYDGPPLWLHGDPHAGNVVIDHGQIVSVIDWGDITSGDPASDLVGCWMMLDKAGRDATRSVLPHDDDTWKRAQGWAVSIAAMVLNNSADRPHYLDLGHRTLSEVISSAA